ncbi:MAG: hypothetical protein VKJ06_08080 [Vampirovibrionales bacterium]|nr:hypothetical protein [Vampirovibrionales bacterium]
MSNISPSFGQLPLLVKLIHDPGSKDIINAYRNLESEGREENQTRQDTFREFFPNKARYNEPQFSQ